MKHKTYISIVVSLNLIIIALLFYFFWIHYYAPLMPQPYDRIGNGFVLLLFACIYVMCMRVYRGFFISTSRIVELVYTQALSLMLTNAVFFVIIGLLIQSIPSFFPLLGILLTQFTFAIVWCFYANKLYFHFFKAMKTAIIYDNRTTIDILIKKYHLQNKFEICSKISINDFGDDFSQLDGIEAVFLGEMSRVTRENFTKHCMNQGITVYILPQIGDAIMRGAVETHLFHRALLCVTRYAPSTLYLAQKRILDIALSAFAFIVLSPIWIVTAIAIKVTDGGPVFYKQARLTQNGKVFNVIKFRSMRVDAEGDGIARLSSGSSDSRITPVGKFIRKLRIDELPQLWCILTGSMSICGPRPERPEIAQEYEKELPDFKLRLQVKAGLTGYAQVYGKYNTTPQDKLLMDLMYISRPSIVGDLKIMLATVKILFMPESTEGISEEMTTACDFTNTDTIDTVEKEVQFATKQ